MYLRQLSDLNDYKIIMTYDIGCGENNGYDMTVIFYKDGEQVGKTWGYEFLSTLLYFINRYNNRNKTSYKLILDDKKINNRPLIFVSQVKQYIERYKYEYMSECDLMDADIFRDSFKEEIKDKIINDLIKISNGEMPIDKFNPFNESNKVWKLVA